MPGIIVSAHGGRWSNQKQDLKVPSKSEVVYYVADGVILSDKNGEEILYALKKGEKPKVPVNETVRAGKDTYDYECWYDDSWAEDCGIFEVGTGRRLLSLKNYTEDHPLKLSEIFKMFPDCTVYWDGCRSVTDPTQYRHHQVQKNSYLAVANRCVMLVEGINDVEVESAVGTLVLAGQAGEYDKDKGELWVKLEHSHVHNGGPVEGIHYTITFNGGAGSPVSLPFKGRFAGVGYEFKS